MTFGLQKPAEWRAVDVRDDGEHTVFEIAREGEVECTARMQAIGAINARNALGAYVLAKTLGLDQAAILDGIAAFHGVARRQERVGEWNGIILIDDFAHHPTAVAGVIAAVRLRYPDRRLWAVFEPRSNTSRRKVFQREYVAALGEADQVLIGSVFRKQSDALNESDLFSPQQLVADLAVEKVAARVPGDADDIAALLAEEACPGDVILMMSNGSFGGLRAKLQQALSATGK
jgi:UDP-N-acetylmuramate: L-alanyl-gamma-D-glutamyl-meso-diaminopimelate ligase